MEGARCLIAEDIRSGTPVDLSDSIEITSEHGELLLNVPFSEAVFFC
jgi:hypothetical protein